MFLVIFPLFFLPLVLDGFGFGKSWFLMAGAIVGLLTWVAGLVFGKKEKIYFNNFWLYILVLAVAAVISLIWQPAGVQVRSIMSVMGVGTMVAAAVLGFLWLQVSSEDEKRIQINWLTVSGLMVALISLVLFLIPDSKLPILLPKNNPILSINQAFSMTGSLISEVVLLLFLLVEWLHRLLNKLKPKEGEDGSSYITEAIFVAIFVLIVSLDAYRIIKLGWVVLDLKSSWTIAVETLKSSPWLGVGSGNFSTAFQMWRPVSFNMTKYWATVFNQSSLGILQLWTELGLIGLVIIFGLVSAVLKRGNRQADFFKLLGFLVVLLFLPLNLFGLLIVIWLGVFGGVFEKRKVGLVLKAGENGYNAAPLLMMVAVVVGTAVGGWFLVRLMMGDVYMRNSFVAAAKNDAGVTYNMQIKAIGVNPNSAEYRKMYSQTNLAIAGGILSNKEMTEDDKQKASVLVQQAVREGKAAISLDNYNSNYWLNLAVIYKNLIGVVDGAADWSFQAYQQAALLDPINPNVKIDLGGLLYAAGRYDEADRVFEQVVANKQDFANGWYNWAYSAKNTNKLADAVQRLTQAVALVPVDSGDFEKANKELAVWKKELDEAIKKGQTQESAPTTTPETLKTAEPLPTVNQKEKVNLPATDLQPPAITPMVTPEAMLPTPTPMGAEVTP